VKATAEGIRVHILDEPLGFGVEEGTRRVPHAITFTEQKLIDRGAGWQVPKHDSVPAGTLSLVITNVRHTRQRWTENASRPLEELLNRFVTGLTRAALALKEQRAAAERREREREEEERRRVEVARRRKVEEQRNREEIAARDRFDALMKAWQKNEQRRAFLADLRTAVGEVAEDSPLGEWLGWAERYIELVDPLERFQAREHTLKLYYSGPEFDLERVRENGFKEPDAQPAYMREKPSPPGIRLQDRPNEEGYLSKSMELDLPEDAVLPYEVTTPGNVPRVFYVPARVLNRLIGNAGVDENPADTDVEGSGFDEEDGEEWSD
jgi:hypothetical protein